MEPERIDNNTEYLLVIINNCKTKDDCYTAWKELDNYYRTFSITEETAKLFYSVIREKFIDILNKSNDKRFA